MDIKNQVLTILFPLVFMVACSTGKKSRTNADMTTMDSTGTRTDSLVNSIISGHPFLDSINGSDYGKDIQVIFTQIDRDKNNVPRFTHHYFNRYNVDYFYPASTVKLPAAALSLQKLRALNIPGLTPTSTMITEAAYSGQSGVYNEPTSPDGRPSVAHYIKKILLVSDNDAYNRLYEFLGQEYLNSSLHSMGFDSTQIIHRLEIALSEDENRHTNPVHFLDVSGQKLYSQPLLKSRLKYQQRHTYMGKGFIRKGALVNEPFNFSTKNRITLFDLHSIVQGVMFPESMPPNLRFQLHDSDFVFLRKYMSMYPSECMNPSYDSSYNDSYVKFLFYGSKDPVEPHIRIFNKVGDAYGFLTDAAYFVDFNSGVEFILSATIHCNSDGIYNDSKYDYETIGLPFMRVLGREIYLHELKRKKSVVPDLSAFRFSYRD